MLFFWIFVVGALLGYLYGYYLKPNRRLRLAIKAARAACQTTLQEGKKGVYRTVITEHNQSSELTVEVQELAVTTTGEAKVAYLSAYYKNPEFRTRKGEALLREVRELLGDYLPRQDVAWYEDNGRQLYTKEQLHNLDNLHNQHFGT